MLSNKSVKNKLFIGYTFVFKGEHHTIIKLYDEFFKCKTQEGRNHFIDYSFFQETNHYKSKFL